MQFGIWRTTLDTLIFLLLAPVAAPQTTGDWTRQIPATFPSPRFAHALAYDSVRGQAVLFGGTNGGPLLNETWVWDGTNWTERFPQTVPPVRFFHAMAYDAAHRQTVLFGGADIKVEGLNDTWVWDGQNWTQVSPNFGPPARYNHAMAYDSARGQVVLFGGTDSTGKLYGDTWVWDGSNWAQKSPTTNATPRNLHAMAFDSAHNQVVMFAGLLPGGMGEIEGNDTWVWDGSNWAQKSPQNTPPARDSYAMAYDSAHGQVVLFGGTTTTTALLGTNPVFNDTWLWDGKNWSQASPPASPPARYQHALAYDSAHAQVVLYGGLFNCPPQGACQNYGDTWTWNGGSVPPIITAVVNGASFVGGAVVPGEIATAFGTNLTSSTGINLTSSLPLPPTFLTDALMVNNKAVALFAVDNVNGQQQINFQVPWEVASGPNATIAVSNNGTAGASITVPVLAAQPGIFDYSAGGNTFGAILHANFQLADTAHPAKSGETVLIYCTGLGAVSSPPADGAAGNGQPTILMPTVTIGGTKAIVSFSGLAPGFVGLYQVNAEVPAGLTAGNQAVVIEVAGASSNSVLLPIE